MPGDDIRRIFVAVLEEALQNDTCAGLGKRTGCSGRAVSYWISGQRKPRDLDVMAGVLEALGYGLAIIRKDQPCG